MVLFALSGELFVVSDAKLHHSLRPPRSLDQGNLSKTEQELQRLRDEAAQDDAVSWCGWKFALVPSAYFSTTLHGGLCKKCFGRQHCVQVGPTTPSSNTEDSSD